MYLRLFTSFRFRLILAFVVLTPGPLHAAPPCPLTRIRSSDAIVRHAVDRAAGARYVRIAIESTMGGRDAVAILGHELQHAVEIAEARWVVDRVTVRELFRTIGHQSGERERYDTHDAVRIGQRVGRELLGSAVHGEQ